MLARNGDDGGGGMRGKQVALDGSWWQQGADTWNKGKDGREEE